jgi:hypothetical protein
MICTTHVDTRHLLRRASIQAQQKGVIRRCLGLMRGRVIRTTLSNWQQWAARQRSLCERLHQVTAQRHEKLRAAVLQQWAAVAATEAAQHRKLLSVVGTMRASALARYTVLKCPSFVYCGPQSYAHMLICSPGTQSCPGWFHRPCAAGK